MGNQRSNQRHFLSVMHALIVKVNLCFPSSILLPPTALLLERLSLRRLLQLPLSFHLLRLGLTWEFGIDALIGPPWAFGRGGLFRLGGGW